MNFELATVLLGGIATLAIYSFLIRENPFYRLFEHLFIGIAAGYGVVISIRNYVWPKVIVPLFGLDIVQFPDGTWSKPYNNLLLLYLIPMAFGLLYYTIYTKKYSWLAKLVIGFSLGASGGAAFEGFFNIMLPQFQSSFKPLVVLEVAASEPPQISINWFDCISNAIFVFTLTAVFTYFFFSFRPRSPVVRTLSSSGRWLMMISFGAYFGSTVMARMALLVERLQFLITKWGVAVGSLLGVS